MRNFTLILLLVLLFDQSFAHPLHFSVTNIDIEKNEMNIAIKVFQDDFTLALKKYFPQNTLSLNDTSETKKRLVQQYIGDRLFLKINHAPVKLKNMHYKLEEISFWIYFTLTLDEEPQQMTIKNSILADYFNDQTNLVIINHEKKEKGLTFDINTQEKTVVLNKNK